MGAYSDRVIADGASNYWRLGEPSGTSATDIIGGATGTISGGVTLAQAGALADGDTAMVFNGTTGKVVTAASGNLVTPYTMETWVRTTVASEVPIFSTANPPNFDGKQIVVNVNNGRLTIVLTFTGGTNAGASILNNGGWHHVVVVFDGTSTPLAYVDTVLQSTMGPLPNPYPGSTNHQIEIGFNASSPAFFNGALDEVAIYPRALSAPEIAAHYALRLAGGGLPWDGTLPLHANRWAVLTPSDSAPGAVPPWQALWVGGSGGDVAIVATDGSVAVLVDLAPGTTIPVSAARVNATGTTATAIVGLREL